MATAEGDDGGIAGMSSELPLGRRRAQDGRRKIRRGSSDGIASGVGSIVAVGSGCAPTAAGAAAAARPSASWLASNSW